MKTLKQLRGILETPVTQDENILLGKTTKEPLEEDVEKQLRAVVKKKREADIKFKSGDIYKSGNNTYRFCELYGSRNGDTTSVSYTHLTLPTIYSV